MNETEFDEQFQRAGEVRDLIALASTNDMPGVLHMASEIDLVLRQTAINEHQRVCTDHSACGWLDVPEPWNVKNDDSWKSDFRQALLIRAREAIKAGDLEPWLPEAPATDPNPQDYPLYRAR